MFFGFFAIDLIDNLHIYFQMYISINLSCTTSKFTFPSIINNHNYLKPKHQFQQTYNQTISVITNRDKIYKYTSTNYKIYKYIVTSNYIRESIAQVKEDRMEDVVGTTYDQVPQSVQPKLSPKSS
jgi:hypothetical protein